VRDQDRYGPHAATDLLVDLAGALDQRVDLLSELLLLEDGRVDGKLGGGVLHLLLLLLVDETVEAGFDEGERWWKGVKRPFSSSKGKSNFSVSKLASLKSMYEMV
jgi:hypothetical protein